MVGNARNQDEGPVSRQDIKTDQATAMCFG